MSNLNPFADAAALAGKLKAYALEQAKLHPNARVRLAEPLAYRQDEAIQSLSSEAVKAFAVPKPVLMPLPEAGSLAATLPRPPYAANLGEFQAQIQGCLQCGLGPKRNKFVFGEGSAQARLVILGDAPGKDEDDSGRPFSGAAGKLLDRMLAAMGSSRQMAYLCHVLKCRALADQAPSAQELEACRGFLEHQLDLLKPTVICALGDQAAQALLGGQESMAKRRGKFGVWRGIPVMPSYHPSAILRDDTLKRPVWDDLKLVVAKLKQAV